MSLKLISLSLKQFFEDMLFRLLNVWAGKIHIQVFTCKKEQLKMGFCDVLHHHESMFFSKDFHAPLNSQLNLKDVFKKLHVTTV